MKRSWAVLIVLLPLMSCSTNALPTATAPSASVDVDALDAQACGEVVQGFATYRKDVKLPPDVLLAQLQSDMGDVRDNLTVINEQLKDVDLELYTGLTGLVQSADNVATFSGNDIQELRDRAHTLVVDFGYNRNLCADRQD